MFACGAFADPAFATSCRFREGGGGWKPTPKVHEKVDVSHIFYLKAPTLTARQKRLSRRLKENYEKIDDPALKQRAATIIRPFATVKDSVPDPNEIRFMHVALNEKIANLLLQLFYEYYLLKKRRREEEELIQLLLISSEEIYV